MSSGITKHSKLTYVFCFSTAAKPVTQKYPQKSLSSHGCHLKFSI